MLELIADKSTAFPTDEQMFLHICCCFVSKKMVLVRIGKLFGYLFVICGILQYLCKKIRNNAPGFGKFNNLLYLCNRFGEKTKT